MLLMRTRHVLALPVLLLAGCGESIDLQPLHAFSLARESMAWQGVGNVVPEDFGAYSHLLTNANNEASAYTGIATIGRRWGTSCTAALIAPPQWPSGVDRQLTPAYVLTSGHCPLRGLPDANAVETDVAASGLEVTFGMFHDTLERQRSFVATRVVYATMKGTDVAVVELEAPLEQLLAEGYTPLRIASEPPRAFEPVEIVGRPFVGLPEEERYLRKTTCQVEERVDLLEGSYHWEHAYRTDCRDIVGGASGAPAISLESGQIVGVMNTVVNAAHVPCLMNQPCEVTPDGETLRLHASYLVRSHEVSGCFDANGVFDLGAIGCGLERQQRLRLENYPVFATNSSLLKVQISATQDTTHYRYKVGVLRQTDCREAEGYGLELTIDEQIHTTVPDVEDRFALCVLERVTDMAGSRGEWNRFGWATKVTWLRDTTPPRATLTVRRSPSERDPHLQVMFASESATDWVTGYWSKMGPPAEVDCRDPRDYRPIRLGFVLVDMSRVDRVKVCALAADIAGNRQSYAEATEFVWPRVWLNVRVPLLGGLGG